jgi:DNA-binding SARP family transcriptional activator
MAIEIKTPVTREKVQQAIEQLSKETGKKNLRKHFGKLKRNINALNHQRLIRNEWRSIDC